jgi:hypothetical protein
MVFPISNCELDYTLAIPAFFRIPLEISPVIS